MLTLLELTEVVGKPKVKMELPRVHLGQRIRLAFCLRRKNAGRSEVLEVYGDFKVAAAGLDAVYPVRQVLSVDVAVGASPTWKAVKKTPEWRRVLPPARAQRTRLA